MASSTYRCSQSASSSATLLELSTTMESLVRGSSVRFLKEPIERSYLLLVGHALSLAELIAVALVFEFNPMNKFPIILCEVCFFLPPTPARSGRGYGQRKPLYLPRKRAGPARVVSSKSFSLN